MPKRQKKLTFSQFQMGFQSLTFDPVLLYVNFGSFDVQPNPTCPRCNHPILEDISTEKRYLDSFFDWLSTTKGVEYIIKLTVNDKDGTPHYDETIVKSLQKFEVEILDWQKVGLRPQVIQNASQGWRNFHRLHLWWNRNNDVPEGWSNPDGLATLKNLKIVHLHEEKVRLLLFPHSLAYLLTRLTIRHHSNPESIPMSKYRTL